MEPDIAATASLFGDPVRATMLTALLDRSSLSAGELAFIANVSPQSASFHLAKLTRAAMLKHERRGRNHLYTLAGREVAAAIEALAAISRPIQPLSPARRELGFARTCYDHLAGRAGVLLHDALLRRGYLAPKYKLTHPGERWLESAGVCVASLRSPFARPCLDWTERRPHLAGRLAAQLLESFFARGWIARIRGTRAVRITTRGVVEFERHYGLNLRGAL